jgi:hypothetical protein
MSIIVVLVNFLILTTLCSKVLQEYILSVKGFEIAPKTFLETFVAHTCPMGTVKKYKGVQIGNIISSQRGKSGP